MKKVNEQLLNELMELMNINGYVINTPINSGLLDILMKGSPQSLPADNAFAAIIEDVASFLRNEPDYILFLKVMDGFEFDGVIIYDFSVLPGEGELPVNNIFLNNDNFRNNDIYINSDLAERVVIGQDSTSFFTYDLNDKSYQIRDNIGTEKIYGVFGDFTDFLSAILSTVK